MAGRYAWKAMSISDQLYILTCRLIQQIRQHIYQAQAGVNITKDWYNVLILLVTTPRRQHNTSISNLLTIK